MTSLLSNAYGMKKATVFLKKMWRLQLLVAAALIRFEVENVALDHAGIPLDFDFPAVMAQKCGLIVIFCEKQPHFISGAAIGGAGTQDGKLDHPSGVVLESLYGKNVVPFQLTG